VPPLCHGKHAALTTDGAAARATRATAEHFMVERERWFGLYWSSGVFERVVVFEDSDCWVSENETDSDDDEFLPAGMSWPLYIYVYSETSSLTEI